MHRYRTVAELKAFLSDVPEKAEVWAYEGDAHEKPGIRVCAPDPIDGTLEYRYFATPYPLDGSGSVR
jgi:hypothetical protein